MTSADAPNAWKPEVPFDASDMGTCRGCDASIGWVQRPTSDGETTKPHPVEVRGYAGIEIAKMEPGAKTGYTSDGRYARVVRPPDGYPAGMTTAVFESHFAHCPKAARFDSRRT